jgi:hypothetical protein
LEVILDRELSNLDEDRVLKLDRFLERPSESQAARRQAGCNGKEGQSGEKSSAQARH